MVMSTMVSSVSAVVFAALGSGCCSDNLSSSDCDHFVGPVVSAVTTRLSVSGGHVSSRY